MKTRLAAILALASCIFASCGPDDYYNYDRPDWNHGGNNGKPIVFEKNNNWKITYAGRFTEPDGQGGAKEVDRIEVKSTDKEFYFVDVITESALQDNYNGSEADYFKATIDNLNKQIADGNWKASEMVSQGNSTVDYDRLRAGSWRAYAIGIDANRKITGSYARLDFTVKEEVPTDEFNRWIGTWKIGGKDLRGDRVSYTIYISSSESNYAYWLRGWEGAKDPDGNDYEFEVEFDRVTGQIVFNSLYFETVRLDDNNDYEVCLNGNIKYNDEYLYINEDICIAEGTLVEGGEGRTARVTGCGVNVNFDNGTTFETAFTSMQMMYVPVDANGKTYNFNSDVPQFPLDMEWISASTKSAGAPASRSVERKARRHNPDRIIRNVKKNGYLCGGFDIE
ncbi:MAG: hypothetical protein II693_03620 [Bacteroidales bacterium]|nr:hypothetical protein [Bacteroidales bacterium]